MQLFNFDHGFSAAQTFEIGPFVISVTDEHCANLKLLPKKESIYFGHDMEGKRNVKHVPKTRGEFSPTADITWPKYEQVPPSILFPGDEGPDAVYDLVMLLSFLTGRQIYLEKDLAWDPRRSYGEHILHGHDLKLFGDRAWESLKTLASRGLSNALSCLVHAPQAPDLIGRGAYVSAAFDSIVTSWATIHKQTKFSDAKLINQAREVIEKTLGDLGVSPETVKDIVNRFNYIKSPSALKKIHWFVEDCKLFPSNPTNDQLGRLRRLNTVRNVITHNGTVPVDEQLGAKLSANVAGAVIMLTQIIAEVYFVRELLGVQPFCLQSSISTIEDFFNKGVFRGQLVFEEEFDDFLSRLDKAWVEDGNC
ncbi:MAG TPA: hypothetical protein DIS96_02965 [Pusillimonas sp.]|nr:hypothetical protein [Pusillimonas sp.]